MKNKNCNTERGNVRRGFWGDGRRTTPTPYEEDYEEEENDEEEDDE